jgi:hypothetical protein
MEEGTELVGRWMGLTFSCLAKSDTDLPIPLASPLLPSRGELSLSHSYIVTFFIQLSMPCVSLRLHQHPFFQSHPHASSRDEAPG